MSAQAELDRIARRDVEIQYGRTTNGVGSVALKDMLSRFVCGRREISMTDVVCGALQLSRTPRKYSLERRIARTLQALGWHRHRCSRNKGTERYWAYLPVDKWDSVPPSPNATNPFPPSLPHNSGPRSRR